MIVDLRRVNTMNQNKAVLKLFWRLSIAYPKRYVLSLLLPVTNVIVASFIGPYIIAQFFNLLQSGNDFTVQEVMPLLLWYLATQIYGEIIGWRIVLYCVWTLETAAQRDLLRMIFKHLTRQPMSFHNDRFGGSIVSQTSKLFGAYERFTDTIVFSAVPIVSSVVGAFVILMFVFWQYALVLLVLSMLFLAIVAYGTRRMTHYNTAEAQASTASTGLLADTVANMLAVKSYAREEEELNRYTETVTNWRSKSLATMKGFLGLSTGYSALIVALNSTALVMSLVAVAQDVIPAGTVYLCITYTFTVARQLWDMNNVGRNINRVMGDAYDMTEILSLNPTIADPKKPAAFTIRQGGIRFDDVTFVHEGQEDALFDKLTLKIKPGEKIGLVGHSGSGKTTLTKLLLRFSDVTSGTISIDGQDITDITQSDLRSKIAYVPQEPLLFHRSILDNIRYAEPSSSTEAVEAAALMANSHDFITSLPEGYNTLVGERGVKLSGGQRQRIVIARALLKNAPILVLDEATSALDSESEQLIQRSLWTLMEGRTAIVIAHRLSTVQRMDRIIVLDQGKIVEQGSHKELIRRNGVYAKLWAHQSGGFIEE